MSSARDDMWGPCRRSGFRSLPRDGSSTRCVLSQRLADRTFHVALKPRRLPNVDAVAESRIEDETTSVPAVPRQRKKSRAAIFRRCAQREKHVHAIDRESVEEVDLLEDPLRRKRIAHRGVKRIIEKQLDLRFRRM